MTPIERQMWIDLEKARFIPRFVKEAVADEWAKGNEGRALWVLVCWQVPRTVFEVALCVLVINWLLGPAS